MATHRRNNQYREIPGPTPHSVSVRAKQTSSRPTEYLLQERRKQEASKDEVLKFTKNQTSCDIKNYWEKKTQGRIISATINRRINEALSEYQMSIDEKRERLRVMLETEEQELLKEMAAKKETMLEKQAKMRERVKFLQEKREYERQRIVSDKLDQLFVKQCEEVRNLQMKRRQDDCYTEIADQIRTNEELKRMKEEEDKMYEQMWENDRMAKEEREFMKMQRRKENDLDQAEFLQKQMEITEQHKIQDKQLREEEALLQKEQTEMLRLEAEREHRQKLQDQETRRKQLDHSFRLKMKRMTRDKQEELALDLSILEKLMNQVQDERQGEALRKMNRRVEQQKYQQYLAEQLEEQKRQEAEIEQMLESELKQSWARKEARWQVEKGARDRLMKHVIETLRLQIQEKMERNMEKQARLVRDREELDNINRENKLMDEEKKARLMEINQEYKADLLAQMLQRQRLGEAEKEKKDQEYQQSLLDQELYNQKIQDILSRPVTGTSKVHPFRRRDIQQIYQSDTGEM